MWNDLARRGGEIAVIGLGRSGLAATRLLRAHDLPVYGSDAGSGDLVRTAAQAARVAGAAAETGGHDLTRIAGAVLAVVSPGVPPGAPPVAAAREAGVEVWAEAELGLRALGSDVPFAAVTGTNGKSTTTALIAGLLAAGGRRAVAAGNIGRPLAEVAMGPERPEAMAVELSSFQLHDMPTLRPTVGVLTNLAPDHLDRYPTPREYYADKRRLFANAHAGSVWVTNADDPVSGGVAGDPPGRHERFSLRHPAAGWLDRAAAALRLGDLALMDRAELPLLGDHNVANALAAALAARALGLPPDRIAEGLRSARPLAHRMEPVREVRGVLWINDSKATNIAATEVAIAALDRPYVLLLGGRHKGEPYTRLRDPLRRGCRAVVAYGEAGPIVTRDLDGAAEIAAAGSFDEVVRTAAGLARPGDAVLLSPACSSYDMFSNFEERGARFRQLVEAM